MEDWFLTGSIGFRIDFSKKRQKTIGLKKKMIFCAFGVR